MRWYIAKRLLLLPPTLFAIIAINFAVVQVAPGGPVQTVLARMRPGLGENGAGVAGVYQGAEGLDAAAVARLDHSFGFDRPPLIRFWRMLRGYLTFDLGTSFFQARPVGSLLLARLPVSLSLGLWSTLLVYMVCVPLGVAKAVRDGTRFDLASSLLILVGYAVPGFLLGILLIVVFGAGGMFAVFPLRGLASPAACGWSWPARVADYGWHLILPTLVMTLGGFAALTMLVKNAFLEEMSKLYVVAARARGTGETRVLFGHVFRNAMLLVVAVFPASFTAILFTSALLVEIIFSLNGLGLLGYRAVLQRDYPVMFGTLYVYTLTGLLTRLVGDVLYAVVDPRVDFSARS